MKLNQFVIALLLVAVSSTYATHIIKPQDSTNDKDYKKKSKKGNKSNKEEEEAAAATIEVFSDQIAATAGELDLSEFDEKNFERAPSIIVQLLSTLPTTSFQNENFGVSKSFVGVDEEGCVMNLVKSGNSVVGSVVCEKTNKIYDIAHLNGKYVITEHSGNDYPDEAAIPFPTNQGSRRNTIVSEHSWANSNDNTTNMLLKEGADHDHGRNLGGQAVIENGNVVIDVMVLYTSKAKCEVANKNSNCPASPIEEKIDLALAETNNAYAMSGVDITLKLVHSQEVQTSDFQESYNSFPDGLNFMRENISNNKKPLKDLHGADLVALIVGSGRYCGMAYLNENNYAQDHMVSVTSQSCMTGYFSFGHEIGHNMGLNHDRGVTGVCNADLSSSNYGYRDPSANFRSIMAYNCYSGSKCCSGDTCNRSCTRVQRFSNTEIKYAGQKIGTSKSNNAEWLNDVARRVSAVNDRPSPAPPSSPAPIALPTSMPTSTPTSSGGKYWIACGYADHGACNNDEQSEAVDQGEKHFVRCCSDISKTGYTNYRCSEVWSGSYLGSDNSCSGALTFTEASNFCSNANGRLCTKVELMNNCARGTGCSYDKELVWTKTADTPLATTPIPTSSPTFVPTAKPTSSPTFAPTPSPTLSPTFATTTQPTSSPTSSPTSAPTPSPTFSPTSSPTFATTTQPTSSTTSNPTSAPTPSPTSSPTFATTTQPTSSPTSSPISAPTSNPTSAPTPSPTSNPTFATTTQPTSSPTSSPTSAPTPSPTAIPTSAPVTLAENHWIACGRIGHPNCDNNSGVNADIKGPAKIADKDEKHFVRCCSDISKTGYTNNYCSEVWSGSKLGSDNSCSGALTFTEASSFCSNADGRLCTKGELIDNCARGTGCSYDKELVWTKTADTLVAAPTAAPVSTTMEQLVCGRKNRCGSENDKVEPATMKHEVRCCALAEPIENKKWRKNSNCAVWGGSHVGSDFECYHSEDFASATSICAESNARLCTKAELENDCAKGSGCSHDWDLVWSNG